MPENSFCPDRETLKHLLLGKLPEPDLEALGEHLLQCERCTKSADTIVAEDDLTIAIHARKVLTGDEEVLTKVLIRGKQLVSQAETVVPDAAGTAQAHLDPNATRIGDSGEQEEDEFGFLSPAQESDEIGRIGDYRILQVLGIGGMGVVFRAEDSRLKRQVAIKVMKPSVASSRSAKDRFIREAQFTAAIEHDNIVQIYQVGEDNGVPFIAMPFLKGESLKKRLERKGRLPQADVVRIGVQVAAGLAAAHERNLIHRDIKPDNLWLEEKTGRVKILDFGLVRASSEDAGLTQSGAVMGTPRYMAPEQAMGEAVDARCDLFSLGSVLYHLVSGKLPFEGANVTATLMAVVQQEPKPLESVADGIHPELVQLISRLLAKDRDNRPAKASEVVKSLTAIHQQLKREASKPANDEPRVEDANTPKLMSRSVRVEPQLSKEESQPIINTKAASPPSSGPPKNRILQAAGAGGILLLMLGVLIYTITDKDGNKTVVKAPSGTPVEFELEPGSKLSVREEADAVTSTATSNLPSQIADPSSGWRGWPADAPKPAIAPFDADQAKKHQEEWAAYLKVPVEYTNSIGMKFRLIPPGEFLMGFTPEELEEILATASDEHAVYMYRGSAPRHRVVITQPFFCGIHEVTQRQFQEVIGENPSHFRESVTGNPKSDSLPVETVSWNDVVGFCAKLGEAEYAPTPEVKGNCYRLPTEAEWEMACRAGTTTNFWNGDEERHLLTVAWYGSNSFGSTHSVGELKPNAFGLYDVHGNVYEWTHDLWAPMYYLLFHDAPAINPKGPDAADSRRVFRGGYWCHDPSHCRSSARFADVDTYRQNYVGFRAALSVEAVSAAIARRTPSNVAATRDWHDWPTDAPKPAIAPFDADQAKKHQEEWAAYLKVPVEYTNSIGMRFRLIPPGEFMMGSTQEEIEACLPAAGDDVLWQNCIKSEGPQHKVILTQPVYIGVNEVTQAQFQQITQKNPSAFAASGKWAEYVAGVDTTSLPVEGVLWNDAVEFCRLLMEKEGLVGTPDGMSAKAPYGNEPYRLPSEAEWEFACRSGSHAAYDNGDSADDLQKVGWYIDNSKDRTHAVGELSSNSFGLFDMHGNAWEWVLDAWSSDWYSRMADQATENPFNPPAGDSERMTRGGNYISGASSCTSASRCSEASAHSVSVIGFRLAMSVDAVRRAMK